MAQTEKNKFIRSVVLDSSPVLKEHNPDTRLYTVENLIKILNLYGEAYIKPIQGFHGDKILRVSRKEDLLLVENEKTNKKLVRLEDFPPWSSPQRLIQQSINTMKLNGKSFVFRYHMQKIRNKFEIVLDAFKVASDEKFVINLAQGNIKVHTVQEGCSWLGITRDTMDRVSLEAAEWFLRNYPGMKEICIDFVIDQEEKPWIVDINCNKIGLNTWKHMDISSVKNRQREFRKESAPILLFEELRVVRKS